MLYAPFKSLGLASILLLVHCNSQKPAILERDNPCLKSGSKADCAQTSASKKGVAITPDEITKVSISSAAATVAANTFRSPVEISFETVEDTSVPSDYEAQSDSIAVQITSDGKVVSPSALDKAIKYSLIATDIADRTRFAIFVKLNDDPDSSENYLIEYDDLSFEDLPNGKVKVSFSSKETDVTFVVVELEAGSSSDTTAPIVDAGSNLHINSATATSASASDADSGIATYAWSKDSGPGAVTFSSSSILNPNISADTHGTYVLRLTVTDVAGNSGSDTLTLEWDTQGPTTLTSFTGATGTSWARIDLSLNLPADTSEYVEIKVYRSSSGVDSTVAAPACGAGTLVKTISNFAVDPYDFTDDTGDEGAYFNYRSCISDSLGNVTSITLSAGVQAKAIPTPNLQLEASDMNGDGTANVGDIDGTATAGGWGDVQNNYDASFTTFPVNSDANAGWQGQGTAADPYLLRFGGGYASTASHASNTIAVWLLSDTINDAATADYVMYKNSVTSIIVWRSSLVLRYSNTEIIHPFHANQWYHVVMTSDGSTRRFYINGVEIGSGAGGVEAANVMYLGSAAAGSDLYDGAIGSYKSYSSHLAAGDVRALYEMERTLYAADPSVLTVDRIHRTLDVPAGGAEALVAGWGLDNVTSVTVDGTSASFTALGDGFLKFTAPAKTAGFKTVVIDDGTTTRTMSDAFLYTDTSIANINMVMDPRSIDGKGLRGSSASSATWVSSYSDTFGALNNFTLPSDANSGWKGVGTSADPYRLQFDGSNDFVSIANKASATYAFWFYLDTMPTSDRYIFSRFITWVRVGNGLLQMTYNNGSTQAIGVTTGQWYHVVMSCDGVNVKYYLDGMEFASQSRSVESLSYLMFLGTHPGASNFDGAIGEFRSYSSELTTAAIRTLYSTQRPLFKTDTGSFAVDAIYGVTDNVSSGAATITLNGANLDQITSITVNGSAATGLATAGKSFLTATAPSIGSANSYNISISDSGGSTGYPAAFKIESPTQSNLIAFFDASNIDNKGTNGASATNKIWYSHKGNLTASINNVSAGANAGWKGDGTTGDPYRLHLDGSDDYVGLGAVLPHTVSVWFNADTSDANSRYIFANSPNLIYVNNGNLRMRYNSGTVVEKIITLGRWYHAAMTFDGATARYYLNGTLIGSEARALPSVATAMVGGAPPTFSSYFDGSIAQLRIYDTGLTSTQVSELYTNDRPRFATYNHTIFATDTTYNGAAVNSLTNADSICQTRATANGFVGAWKAIISSSSEDAVDRILIVGDVYNTRSSGAGGSQQITDDLDDLWTGSLLTAVGYDAAGTNTFNPIWTGTDTDGTAHADTCGDWVGGGNNGAVGDPGATNGSWISASGGVTCASTYAIYCIDQN